MTPKDRLDSAISAIRSELRERLDVLNGEGKLLEAQRLEQRLVRLGDAGPGGYATGWRTTPVIWPAVKGTPPSA